MSQRKDGADSSEHLCSHCSMKGTLRCGRCKSVHYCSATCQKAHWAVHKSNCELKPSTSSSPSPATSTAETTKETFNKEQFERMTAYLSSDPEIAAGLDNPKIMNALGSITSRLKAGKSAGDEYFNDPEVKSFYDKYSKMMRNITREDQEAFGITRPPPPPPHIKAANEFWACKNEENYIDMVHELSFSIGDVRYWLKRDAWLASKDVPQRLIEAGRLPFLSPRLEPSFDRYDSRELWVLSFTQLQESCFILTITIEYFGGKYDALQIAGTNFPVTKSNPGTHGEKDYVIAAVCDTMVSPNQKVGQFLPHRPNSMLVAYRFHSIYADIEEAMRSLQITCQLETKEAAKITAKNHGTHYMGLNWNKICANCECMEVSILKSCAVCRNVKYCSPACQKEHWKVHKAECKKNHK